MDSRNLAAIGQTLAAPNIWLCLMLAALAIALNVHAMLKKRAAKKMESAIQPLTPAAQQQADQDGIPPRADEQYLGRCPVVQVRRRDYDSGKVTEAIVISDGRRVIATGFGDPLPLSAEPRDLTGA